VLKVVENRRLGKACVGAAQFGRHARMQPCLAANVQLVQHAFAGCDARMAR
jgi:hypothetical protein